MSEGYLSESDEWGPVGVGGSTIPPFLQLLAGLGISESEFVQATQASFNLGIGLEAWGGPGHRYFNPFGTIGQMATARDVYHIWLRAAAAGQSPPQLGRATGGERVCRNGWISVVHGS